jgi:hypothetical protein
VRIRASCQHAPACVRRCVSAYVDMCMPALARVAMVCVCACTRAVLHWCAGGWFVSVACVREVRA